MYQPEDKLRMSEEDEESKPLLEEEFEDYKDSKLLTWFECEDAVSATWCDTEETLLTWHESEVGPLPVCHVKEINLASKQCIHDNQTSFDV
jgi:hypothetical protein